MPMNRKQQTLMIGHGASILSAAILAWAVGHFFKVDPRPALGGGLLVSFSTMWSMGGRVEWPKLSRGWKALTLIAAGAILFVSVALFGIFAVAEPHRSEWLIMASGLTVAAGVLLVLYALFSRAADAVWSRWQRRH